LPANLRRALSNFLDVEFSLPRSHLSSPPAQSILSSVETGFVVGSLPSVLPRSLYNGLVKPTVVICPPKRCSHQFGRIRRLFICQPEDASHVPSDWPIFGDETIFEPRQRGRSTSYSHFVGAADVA
jgi:hypothetical protein